MYDPNAMMTAQARRPLPTYRPEAQRPLPTYRPTANGLGALSQMGAPNMQPMVRRPIPMRPNINGFPPPGGPTMGFGDANHFGLPPQGGFLPSEPPAPFGGYRPLEPGATPLPGNTGFLPPHLRPGWIPPRMRPDHGDPYGSGSGNPFGRWGGGG